MNQVLANATNVILKTLLIISTLILCDYISSLFLDHTIPSLLLPSINTTTVSLYLPVLHASNISEIQNTNTNK
jgi:hypothetical protein